MINECDFIFENKYVLFFYVIEPHYHSITTLAYFIMIICSLFDYYYLILHFLFFFDQPCRWHKLVVRCLILVREVWGSNPEPIKFPTRVATAATLMCESWRRSVELGTRAHL